MGVKLKICGEELDVCLPDLTNEELILVNRNLTAGYTKLFFEWKEKLEKRFKFYSIYFDRQTFYSLLSYIYRDSLSIPKDSDTFRIIMSLLPVLHLKGITIDDILFQAYPKLSNK